MTTIELVRELGKSIQKEEKYLNLKVAQQNSDEDQSLQDAIGEFNLKRMAINNEAQKENRDEEKLQELNTELREIYAKVMENKNMVAYNEAKTELDTLVQRIMGIIGLCVEGEDPETCEYTPASCSGSCSSCSSCG